MEPDSVENPDTDEGPAVITLLSDRGSGSEWVGTLHSILCQMAPHARVIDLAHDVAVDDIRAASLTLARAVQYIAPGVIVVTVASDIDPATRHVAISAADGNAVFIGPDNGVLASAIAMIGGADSAVELDLSELHLESPGAIDPARDVYAPVAANLVCGSSLGDVGTVIGTETLRPGLLPLPSEEDGLLVCEVLAVGHRGVIHLNVDPVEIDSWGPVVSVQIGERRRTARRVDHPSMVVAGAIGLVTDTIGMVSIVSSGASAAEELATSVGDSVRLASVNDETPAGPNSAGEDATAISTPVTVGRSASPRLDRSDSQAQSGE